MQGQQAPDFTLSDQGGKTRKLSDYRGRWVVLYFYTHDDALGCTRQACSFRDEYRIIKQFGNAEIIGVNHGSIQTHNDFAKRHGLKFPILSDPGHKITRTYNSWRKLRNNLLGENYATQRNTFLINPEGLIVKTYIGVKRSANHTEQIIQDLQTFQASA